MNRYIRIAVVLAALTTMATVLMATPGSAAKNVSWSSSEVVAFADPETRLGTSHLVRTKWGAFGSGDGEFDSPIGVAVDASNDVYVADFNNDRVQKFGPQLDFLIAAPDPLSWH